jgi:hypothetical protein
MKNKSLPLAMAFSKAFPERSDKSVYPRWHDIALTREQEKSAEEHARKENLLLMRECIDDAKILLAEPDQSENVVRLAVAFFDKRASHVAFYKEELAQELFKKMTEKKL